MTVPRASSSIIGSPWLSVFPEASQIALPCEYDLFVPGEASDKVFFIVSGAVVETRTDHLGTSHAVGLSGIGALLGAHLSIASIRDKAVRATTLTEASVRVVPRSAFLHSTLHDPDLARAFMTQLARRLEIARQLSEVCSSPSACDHILGLLHTVANVCGADPKGTSNVAIPSGLLERMTGTPKRIVEASLRELRLHGIVELERDAIRWVM